MILDRQFINRDHIRRFTVRPESPGWNVREEHDSTVINETHYGDWHHVELHARLFQHTARALEQDGWVER
jgi:hypothetical protein